MAGPMSSRSPRDVLITGAQGALGREVVSRFASQGCQVLATFHGKSAPAAAPGVEWVEMDVTQAASVRAGVTRARQGGRHLDALVHCAGGFRWAKIEDTTDADLDFLLDVNLRSALLLVRELIPGMKAQNFGRIVLLSSRATLAPPAGMGAYAATKAGLNALVAAVADEVRPHDININAVLPTVIDTPANRRDMPQADVATWVTPRQLADLIFALTQPLGQPVNGAAIPVAGRL
jgi:NAD(P)-dependent dehydrogenase (short-subunit alcohol dehydrogenase family)